LSDNLNAPCGYVCYPRDNNAQNLIEYWKNSDVVKDLYFATATFAFESSRISQIIQIIIFLSNMLACVI